MITREEAIEMIEFETCCGSKDWSGWRNIDLQRLLHAIADFTEVEPDPEDTYDDIPDVEELFE